MNKKEKLKLIKISKEERNYLESKGFTFGEHLHKTISNVGTYYATESKPLINCLNDYRRSHIIKTVGGRKFKKNR